MSQGGTLGQGYISESSSRFSVFSSVSTTQVIWLHLQGMIMLCQSDDPASVQGVMRSSLMRWREHSMGTHVIVAIVNTWELFSCEELEWFYNV